MTEKYNMPDARGHFGPYGGLFVAETLIPPIQELNAAYQKYMSDPEFIAELDADLQHYVGRPSPLYYAERWSRELGGAQIYLKREDLNHTGSHKINNTVGQALLAKRMGKTRNYCRNGRRSTRCCNSNSGGASGSGMRGVYGGGGCCSSIIKRVSHEVTGRDCGGS